MIRFNVRGSNVRSNLHDNRNVRLGLCALALVLGSTVARGQWLETRITLPDSLGGATNPTCLTADSSERYVYVGDFGGSVYVLDAEVGIRVAKVQSGCVAAVCTDAYRDKVYAADCVGNQVIVISCATNQAVAAVPVGTKPVALCYNSNDDKVYCANYGSDDLSVIDCSSDSVIKTIHTASEPYTLCYNPAGNRVFCKASDTLVVLDGASDSVVAVYAGMWHGPLVVNAVSDRVYVRGSFGSGAGVHVLDGTTGVVLDSMRAGVDVMCLNSYTQRLYAGDSHLGSVSVFDCTADTLIDIVRVGALNSVACDTAMNRVYIAGSNEIVVVDGVADSVKARIAAGCDNGELLGSSKRSLMYFTGVSGTELSVVNTSSDTLFHTIKIGGGANPMCYDSTDDKVYYVSNGVFVEVGAIDAATNQPVAHIPAEGSPEAMVWHAPANKVYYASGVAVSVIDPRADTVAKKIAVSALSLCSASDVNKVYCGGSKLWAIDCSNDSVVKTIEPMDVSDMCYVHTASYDKLYCNGMDAIWVIDCARDTVIRTYPRTTHAFASDPQGKRVYCSGNDSLFVFDAAGDTPVAAIPYAAGRFGSSLLYVPGANKIYLATYGDLNDDHILAFDPMTSTFIAQMPTHLPAALGYDGASGLVYCCRPSDDKIMFIDSRTDSVIDSLSPCLHPCSFVMVPSHSRVYVGNGGNSFIPVIRSDPPGVAEATLPSAQKKSTGPTIVSRSSPLVIQQPSVLLDAVGRKVLDLRSGANDLRALVPGIYFIREEPQAAGLKPQSVRKVALTE